MRLEDAVATVGNLRRYRQGRSKTYWHHLGPFVSQFLVPVCTKAQERGRDLVMTTKGKKAAVRWVDAHRIRSTQHCLRFKNLLWNVKNHAKMQRVFGTARTEVDIRGINLPIVVYVGGTPILWNGNHRVTANLLLGKRWIRCRCFKAR